MQDRKLTVYVGIGIFGSALSADDICPAQALMQIFVDEIIGVTACGTIVPSLKCAH